MEYDIAPQSRYKESVEKCLLRFTSRQATQDVICRLQIIPSSQRLLPKEAFLFHSRRTAAATATEESQFVIAVADSEESIVLSTSREISSIFPHR